MSFETILLVLSYITTMLIFGQVYLALNQVWKKRHSNQVAASISLVSMTIGFFINIVWATVFIVQGQNLAIFTQIPWLAYCSIMFMIGLGLWVKSESDKSFIERLKSKINRERSSTKDIIKSVNINTQEVVIDILKKVAFLDNKLHYNEKNFIESFAADWGIKNLSFQSMHESMISNDKEKLISLKKEIAKYLSSIPDEDQISHLQDLIRFLMHIDGNFSAEEKLAWQEIDSLFNEHLANYNYGISRNTAYQLLIIPFSENFFIDDKINSIFKKKSIKNQVFFKSYSFYSWQFVQDLKNKYTFKDTMTVIEKINI